MQRRRSLALGLLALPAVALSACGTTAPLSAQLAVTRAATGEGAGVQGDSADPGLASVAGSGGLTGTAGESGTSAGSGAAAGAPATVGTVDGSGGAGGASGSAGTGSVTGGSTAGGTATGTAGSPGTAGVPRKGTAGSATRSTGKPSAAATAATGTKLVNGPGVTDKTITVGFPYTENASAAQAALGNNVNYGDPLAEAKAVVAYINGHGGLAGRSLDLEPYEVSSTSSETSSQLADEACQNYTSDVHAFAVVGASVSVDEFRQCLAGKGISEIGSGLDQVATTSYAQAPDYFDTIGEPPELGLTNLVTALAGDGYLTTKWDTGSGKPGGVTPVRIGVIYPTEPRWTDAVNNYLLPGLKAHGVTVDPADIYGYTFPNSNADDASTISQIEAAVLKFRSDGVTNVIPVEVNALAFFAIGAQPQGYFPRYGLESSTQAQSVYTSGLVPASQLAGAVGLGWDPLLDLPTVETYGSAGLSSCLKIMSGANIQLSGSVAELVAAEICDEFLLLQRGVNGIPKGQAITSAAVTTALNGIGSSFPNASLPGASYAPDKHYPVNTGYAWAWDSSSNAFVYSGQPIPLK